jgi:hypothetical protein
VACHARCMKRGVCESEASRIRTDECWKSGVCRFEKCHVISLSSPQTRNRCEFQTTPEVLMGFHERKNDSISPDLLKKVPCSMIPIPSLTRRTSKSLKIESSGPIATPKAAQGTLARGQKLKINISWLKVLRHGCSSRPRLAQEKFVLHDKEPEI